MSLSTHVLDSTRGRPAAGMEVTCEVRDGVGWRPIVERRTDADGRIADLIERGDLQSGVYRLVFATGAWADAANQTTFWPKVTVEFEVTSPGQHHHVPLLLSPYGYSTYRGS